MSCSLKGDRNPMWRNAKRNAVCKQCGAAFKFYTGSSAGIYCSKSCMYASPHWRYQQQHGKVGYKHSEQSKALMSLKRKGVPKSPAGRLAIVNGIRERFRKHVSIQSEYRRIRGSAEYRQWIKDVIAKDGCKCANCGQAPKKLDAHHKHPFAMLVEEFKMGLISEPEIHRIDNGITLCRACHRAYHLATGGFTPIEVILLRTLKKLWKQSGELVTFVEFYRSAMEAYIDDVKGHLQPV